MKRLALLGSPVDAALSPVLHRAAYAAMGLPWTYHAIECRSQDLPRFLASLGEGWGGFSLTMPLKRTVLPLLAFADCFFRNRGSTGSLRPRAGRGTSTSQCRNPPSWFIVGRCHGIPRAAAYER